MPGTIVGGRYQLRAAIGNGGMGTVWQAVDTVLRRDVAVKEVLLPPGMPPAERTAMYERTFREGRAAAALSHPSVVQVYDVVTENGRPWIVMELLQARSLSEIIISDGPLAGRAVAKIGIALLGALEVAHAAGVLHRDVKPANVLICADGRCVLTDFGVARMPSESNLTQPGMVLGSPHFISPERAIGAAFGPPSDLFSLGVTLYTAAEGRPPFDRGDPFETMRAIVEDQPAPASRAGVLTPVLMGLLEKDPEKRWTVTEARKALRDLTNGALTNRAATQPTDPQAIMPTSGRAHSALHETPATYALPATAEQTDPSRLGGRAMLAPGETVNDRVTAAARHGAARRGDAEGRSGDARRDRRRHVLHARRRPLGGSRIGPAGGLAPAGPTGGRDVLGTLGRNGCAAVDGRTWLATSRTVRCRGRRGRTRRGVGHRLDERRWRQTADGVHRPDDAPDTRRHRSRSSRSTTVAASWSMSRRTGKRRSRSPGRTSTSWTATPLARSGSTSKQRATTPSNSWAWPNTVSSAVRRARTTSAWR